MIRKKNRRRRRRRKRRREGEAKEKYRGGKGRRGGKDGSSCWGAHFMALC